MVVLTAPTARTVLEATRFTATTPHAGSKAAEPPVLSRSRFMVPHLPTNQDAGRSRPAPSVGEGKGGAGASAGPTRRTAGAAAAASGETMEQRVARLRAAHDQARMAKVSRYDQIVAMGRRFFDRAHRATVVGLIGFTLVAGALTAYTAIDMVLYNKKRRAEFFEAQKNMEAESLAAARLAYMQNKATPEQVALVEEFASAEESAKKGSIFSFSYMPNLFTPFKPKQAGETTGENPTAAAVAATARITEAATWPGAGSAQQQQNAPAPKQLGTITSSSWASWFRSSSITKDAQLSTTIDGTMTPTAQDSFGKEKDNQRHIRVGELKPTAERPQKKGW